MTWIEDTFGGTDPYGIAQSTAAYNAWINSPQGQAWSKANDAANAESQRRYNAEYGLKKQTLDQDYAYKKSQAKTAAQQQQIDNQYRQDQANLAREQYQSSLSLNQGKLGLDYINADVAARNTPDDYFKEKDLEAGASGRQDVPIFLQNLLTNTQGPSFQAPGGTPTPGSLSAVTSSLTGGNTTAATPSLTTPAGTSSGTASSTAGTGASAPPDPRIAGILAIAKAAPPSGTEGYSDQDKTALTAIQSLYAQGFGKLGPQALEGAGSVGRSLIAAGGRRLGYDPSISQEQYQGSRFLGGPGNLAAA